MNDGPRIIGSNLRARDYYAQRSADALHEMNQRQKRAFNGGYTDGQIFIGSCVTLFRLLPRTARVVVLVVLVLFVASYFFG